MSRFRSFDLSVSRNLILANDPCEDGLVDFDAAFPDLVTNPDKLISLVDVAKGIKIEYAIWCLGVTPPEQVEDTKLFCRLFAGQVAMQSLHIFESDYPDDKWPRKAIEIALSKTISSVADAAYATYDAAHAARAAYATDAADAADAAYAAVDAAYPADAAYAAARAADAADAAARAATRATHAVCAAVRAIHAAHVADVVRAKQKEIFLLGLLGEVNMNDINAFTPIEMKEGQ
jgi:hypothetical protein